MSDKQIPTKYLALTMLAEAWLATCRPLVKVHYCARKQTPDRTPAVIALWHQALVYTLYHFRSIPGVIMVSGNRDGEWVAKSLEKWGQIPVRGSRHKGGLRAIKLMGRLMKQHGIGAGIVADGSQGPARKAQLGALALARDTGYPVIPTGFAASACIRFNSWDRMILPLPFSRVAVVYGEPVRISPGARGCRMEEARQRLENALDMATLEAERMIR